MVDLRFVTVRSRWGIVQAGLKPVSAGQAAVAFMEEFQNGSTLPLVRMGTDFFVLQRDCDPETLLWVFYAGGDADLRFIREAFWYYTRPSRFKHHIEPAADFLLYAGCTQLRPELEPEADAVASCASTLREHWRCALLFAARVKDRRAIKKALALEEAEFALGMIRAIDLHASGSS